MQALTDEERKKLCNALRSPNWFYGPGAQKAEEAADEIERLANEVSRLEEELELVRHDEERFIYD